MVAEQLQVADRVVGKSKKLQGKQGEVIAVYKEKRQRTYDIRWDCGAIERVAARAISRPASVLPTPVNANADSISLDATRFDDDYGDNNADEGESYESSSSEDSEAVNLSIGNDISSILDENEGIDCHGRKWYPCIEVLVDNGAHERYRRAGLRWPTDLQLGSKDPIKYFYLTYPMETLSSTVTFTNAVLLQKHKLAMTQGEFLRWLGIRIAMAYDPCKGGIKAYWKTADDEDGVGRARDFGSRFHMSRHRFEHILYALTFVDSTIASRDHCG
ncbi:TPA: hypothetical protein N0F65_006192 [Lagenidium giganteum]|uniref:PiggyBac transposable element-derived protein domain-containing protein n=1 Tax=Lagenidium giganteum TaxID=4803 RepID=A0AAV2Z6J2_9STRA|nr:TPA: hypothetical protein N0F65_006192 [Lagenidium giganteum]